MCRVLILHGPNLNRLGKRETNIYGYRTLEEINEYFIHMGKQWDWQVECIQSNVEGELINHIHRADEEFDYIVFNPAAYTHYSYALRDAIASIEVPVIEVHLTNTYQRESFREKSITAPVCQGQIIGFGCLSYALALLAIKEMRGESGTTDPSSQAETARFGGTGLSN